jgi:hypothetical protein
MLKILASNGITNNMTTEKNMFELDVVETPVISATWEGKAGGSQVQGQPEKQ